MHSGSKIYVAGHRGLVGSAIMNRLSGAGYENIVVRSSTGLDLRDQKEVEIFFRKEKPEYVFMAAARVGWRKRCFNQAKKPSEGIWIKLKFSLLKNLVG